MDCKRNIWDDYIFWFSLSVFNQKLEGQTMIEEYIEIHIRKQLDEFYPEILPDQIIVKFPEAAPDYTFNKMRDTLAREILQCAIIIQNQDRIDRALIYRALPRLNVVTDDYNVFQELKRITHTDYLEVYQLKGYLVELEYKHLIKET